MVNRKALPLLILALALAVSPAAAKKKRHDRDRHAAPGGAAYITADEIRALEKSGHLTSQGPDSWRTKGGVLIKGKDPDGRSRLAHVMRHTVDEPSRPKHGVFSIDKAKVLDLMDETWAKIKSGSLKGDERGGRVAYLYRTGRQVGYLGGRDGAQKGKPALKGVRMVVKKGSSEVVTFFPQ